MKSFNTLAIESDGGARKRILLGLGRAKMVRPDWYRPLEIQYQTKVVERDQLREEEHLQRVAEAMLQRNHEGTRTQEEEEERRVQEIHNMCKIV